MNYSTKNTLTISLIILLSFVNTLAFCQNDIDGITNSQANGMKKQALDLVKNYYATINLIATSSSDDESAEDVRAYSSVAEGFFENGENDVYNNLIKGNKEMPISRYISTISTVFAKNPGEIFSSSESSSNVYLKEKAFIVKVSAIIKVKGYDNSNILINRSNVLDAYVRFKIRNKSISKPHIFNIIENSNEVASLTPVNIVETSSINTNVAEMKKIQAELDKTKNELSSKSQELQSIREKWAKRNIDLDKRQNSIVEKEKELKNAQDLIKKQLSEIHKRESEIDKQKRELQRKADLIYEKDKQLTKISNRVESDVAHQYSKRLILEFSLGAYTNSRTLENKFNKANSYDFDISLQIGGMIGYRFDFNTKINNRLNRGTVAGLFITYGINSKSFISDTYYDQNINMPVARQDPIYNRSLEAEFGVLFREFFRLSGGFGRMNGLRYNTATTSFKIPIGTKFLFEFGSSLLFGQDFNKTQIRPFANIAFQLNDKTAKSLKSGDKKGRLYMQFSTDAVYSSTFKSSNYSFTELITPRINMLVGSRIKERTIIGLQGEYGNFNQNIINDMQSSSYINNDTLNNSYNPYYSLGIGLYLWDVFKISYSYGQLERISLTKFNYHNITFGASINLLKEKELIRLSFDVSNKFFDNDPNKYLFGGSIGLSMRFNFAR